MHMSFGCGVKSPCTRVHWHGENLILRAIHEVVNERPRRRRMKGLAQFGAESTYEIFWNLPGTVLKPSSKMKRLDLGLTRLTFNFHD